MYSRDYSGKSTHHRTAKMHNSVIISIIFIADISLRNYRMDNITSWESFTNHRTEFRPASLWMLIRK